MTATELKAQQQALKKVTREATSSPEAARKLLVKAGIITRKGNLRKPYK